MFFFFRTPTITVDFFTSMPHAFDYAKPTMAINNLPMWWRNLPKKQPTMLDAGPTMKGCPGLIELYKRGIVMPLWSDLLLTIGGTDDREFNFEYQFSDFTSDIEAHTSEQTGNFYHSDIYQNIKFLVPWKIRASSNDPFLMTDVTYNRNSQKDFFVPNGILHLDRYVQPNINAFFARHSSHKEYFFKHGTPLVHLIPLTNKKVKLKTHLISQQESMFLDERIKLRARIKFFNGYLRAKNIKDKEGC